MLRDEYLESRGVVVERLEVSQLRGLQRQCSHMLNDNDDDDDDDDRKQKTSTYVEYVVRALLFYNVNKKER